MFVSRCNHVTVECGGWKATSGVSPCFLCWDRASLWFNVVYTKLSCCKHPGLLLSPPISPQKHWNYKHTLLCPILHGSWNLNLGSHTCVTNVLSSKTHLPIALLGLLKEKLMVLIDWYWVYLYMHYYMCYDAVYKSEKLSSGVVPPLIACGQSVWNSTGSSVGNTELAHQQPPNLTSSWVLKTNSQFKTSFRLEKGPAAGRGGACL